MAHTAIPIMRTSLSTQGKHFSLRALQDMCISSACLRSHMRGSGLGRKACPPCTGRTSRPEQLCQAAYEPAQGVVAESAVRGLSAMLDGLRWTEDGLVVAVAQVAPFLILAGSATRV